MGAGLDDEEIAFGTGPFDVHGHAVVVFYRRGLFADGADLRVRQAELASVAGRLLHQLAGRLVHDRAVRRDVARHQRLAQPPRGVDRHLVVVVGDRIDREGDAGGLAAHQRLHDDCDRGRQAGDFHATLVQNDSFAEAGFEACPHGRFEVDYFDAEHGLVQPCERGPGQVLFRRRRAHGKRAFRLARLLDGGLLLCVQRQFVG